MNYGILYCCPCNLKNGFLKSCFVANSARVPAQVITVEDYNEYCHYVAGIVGLGLSRLFHASGLEAEQPDELSNSMGLFLQVLTNA